MSPPDARSSARALGASILMTTAGSLPAFLTGAVGVQVKADLGVGDSGLGLAVAALFASATLVAARAGRLADRLGWRRSVRVVAVLSALTLAGVAVLGGTYAGLVACLLAGGLGFALTTPAANLALARTIPSGRRGAAFGIQQGAVPLSTLLAGLAVPAVALTVGWRWAFGLAVALPVAAGLLVPPAGTGGAEGEGAVGTPQRFAVPPALAALAVAGALSSLSIGALHGFGVVSAVQAGVGEGTAGALVAVASLVSIAVRVVAGRRVDAAGTDGFRGVALLLGLGGLGYVLLALRSAPLVAPGMLLAYGAAWGWPGLFQYGIVRRFPVLPASATGVIQTGFAAGTAAGPLAFGLATDRVGYAWSWAVVAACCAVAAILIDRAAARLPAARAVT